MKTTLLSLATALALGALAGCDRTPNDRASQTPPTTSSSGGATSAPATPQSNTPTTPANIGGQPQSQAEKREGSNPVQQQVDPKEPAQRRDFKSGG